MRKTCCKNAWLRDADTWARFSGSEDKKCERETDPNCKRNKTRSFATKHRMRCVRVCPLRYLATSVVHRLPWVRMIAPIGRQVALGPSPTRRPHTRLSRTTDKEDRAKALEEDITRRAASGEPSARPIANRSTLPRPFVESMPPKCGF